ncbi:GH25 family lysozyme [Streptomyces sp. NPDC046197]|uniref:GH25 family lysozyme n=1 Tax=Streptomyces sp. NPDC046197 TaxID=3154337 RepID=UPI003405AC5C
MTYTHARRGTVGRAGWRARGAAVLAAGLAALCINVHGVAHAATTAATGAARSATTVRGLDVSGYNPHVDWKATAAKGAAFAYVKATEGVSYTNSYFSQQYNGAAGAGLIRGAYHFARPDASGGRAQADYFLAHGGKWTRDGKTLPGALDIEANAHGDTCYGLSRSAMTSWIAAFVNEYQARTGRHPVIYTAASWWATCTGNYGGFGRTDPLWIVNQSGTPTPLPAGWNTYTVWQTAASGTFPGDQDVFNGSLKELRTFALGDYTPPPPAPGWPLVQQGQAGRQVNTVQYLLGAHGASLTVDGRFGAGTRDAVVAFQRARGLTPDGVVGPNTWQHLVVTVRQGDTGAAVRAVQEELKAHGAAVTVDGRFGAGTRDAVVTFQKSRGLPQDGVVGANTWMNLVS